MASVKQVTGRKGFGPQGQGCKRERGASGQIDRVEQDEGRLQSGDSAKMARIARVPLLLRVRATACGRAVRLGVQPGVQGGADPGQGQNKDPSRQENTQHLSVSMQPGLGWKTSHRTQRRVPRFRVESIHHRTLEMRNPDLRLKGQAGGLRSRAVEGEKITLHVSRPMIPQQRAVLRFFPIRPMVSAFRIYAAASGVLQDVLPISTLTAPIEEVTVSAMAAG